MTQMALILAQLVWLALPTGWCTCARADRSSPAQASDCCTCSKDKGCRCLESNAKAKAKPKTPGKSPCSDPNCPATVSAAKSVKTAPGAPVKAPTASLGRVVEPPTTGSKIAEHRPTDSILLPTAYLFLIYGAMLV